jgi:16S rRNA (uracil1498-N3)-methyltransferase
MSERFFVESPIHGSHARLLGSEAQHAAKVMRAKVGDELTLFDGSGAEFTGRITAVTRQEIELEILERREVDRELAREVTLAVALPKGDRQQWLVEKLTELGVTRLVPLICQRSVAQPVDSALARLGRWVVEASKQCGRNKLMQIAPPVKWTDYARDANSGLRMIAYPEAATFARLQDASGPLIAAVGPEGGWTDEEISLALAAGWQPLFLGPRILRVETAAITIAAQAATPIV